MTLLHGKHVLVEGRIKHEIDEFSTFSLPIYLLSIARSEAFLCTGLKTVTCVFQARI